MTYTLTVSITSVTAYRRATRLRADDARSAASSLYQHRVKNNTSLC